MLVEPMLAYVAWCALLRPFWCIGPRFCPPVGFEDSRGQKLSGTDLPGMVETISTYPACAEISQCSGRDPWCGARRLSPQPNRRFHELRSPEKFFVGARQLVRNYEPTLALPQDPWPGHRRTEFIPFLPPDRFAHSTGTNETAKRNEFRSTKKSPSVPLASCRVRGVRAEVAHRLHGESRLNGAMTPDSEGVFA